MIAEKLPEVEEKIEAAKAGRTPQITEDVQLVAVTKNHDVAAMREAIDAGVTDIGENRIQEAMGKYETLGRQVTWHLIGHLQTNKVKYIIDKVWMIHSVDSVHLMDEIDRQAQKHGVVMKILIQVITAVAISQRIAHKTGIFFFQA